jgi:hypothetical protein
MKTTKAFYSKIYIYSAKKNFDMKKKFLFIAPLASTFPEERASMTSQLLLDQLT